MLVLVPGRSAKAFADWLIERGQVFRAGVTVAPTPDPFHAYKTAIDEQLEDAVAVLDAFHVVTSGTAAVDECRRRVQQDPLGSPRIWVRGGERADDQVSGSSPATNQPINEAWPKADSERPSEDCWVVILSVPLKSRVDAVFDVLIARQIMSGACPTPELRMRGKQYGRALPLPVSDHRLARLRRV